MGQGRRLAACAALVVGVLLAWVPAQGASAGRFFVVYKAGTPLADRFAVAAAHGAPVVHVLGIVDALVVHASESAALRMAADPRVAYVEPDGPVWAIGHSATETSKQWGVTKIGADDAWSTSTGAGIKVAVVDTGISDKHPDLAVAGGWNVIRNNSRWNDDNGHGSHVAGIIGAKHNGSGVVGVAHGASLYAVKVLNAGGSGTWSDVAKGVDWCVANGMHVVNMSLGGGYNGTVETAINNAAAAGLLFSVAAGNSGPSDNTVGFPATMAAVMAISASTTSDGIASFSSRGPQVDLAAPGASVYSTYKGKSYATLSGTSMAAPQVAGAAALVWSANSGWSASDVRARLEATAVDLGAAGTDNVYGHGRVDAGAAVAGP